MFASTKRWTKGVSLHICICIHIERAIFSIQIMHSYSVTITTVGKRKHVSKQTAKTPCINIP